MSDTPRTDAAYAASTGVGIYELFKEAQDIERELNAANQRIKRLEEAGDGLLELCEAEVNQHNLADEIDARCKSWRKAKESKL